MADSRTRPFRAYTLAELERHLQAVEVRRRITHIQIHHTYRPRKTDYKGEETIRAMWRYHTGTRGWRDIGQHFTVSPDGLIWDGRSLELDPAGIAGHNEGGLMFEMIGNFDKGEERLEGEQLNSVLGAVHLVLRRFGLPSSSIVFHREHAPKTCPGSGIEKEWFVAQVERWGLNRKASDFPFADVPEGHYAREAIQALAGAGILKGMAEGRFGFGLPLKREEAAVLLWRLWQKLKE